ncbi:MULTISPECIES: DUF6463 family protein [Nocardiopsis]|uniref:DUF6463 family protein n=1 Tax=Nocardiopsis TaxID=2013 RepID=UPI001EFA0377|nr:MULTISPECIES: DUF6463 family protein [Nocardiopsis]
MDTSARLTVAGGWSMAAIALLHTLFFLPHPYWGEWFSGELWSHGTSTESMLGFWALPGGFVVPLAVLGLLVARTGRRGEAVPAYAGWAIGLWALGCAALVGPSGFLLGLVPAGLLIGAGLARRSGDRRRAAEAWRA